MTENKETKTKGDVNAELNEACSWISNPISIIKQNPFIFSEQPENPYIADIGNGAFSNLTGVHKINGKMQMAMRMIAGKGNNTTEVFGEDIQTNTYAFRIAEACAHLDENIGEEIERVKDSIEWEYFEKPERIGWAYAAKSHKFGFSMGCSEKKFENENFTSEKDRFKKVYIIQTKDMGCTDERVKTHCEAMPVEEKAEKVISVQRFDGEMDVTGQRTHFRHNHWINGGESVQEHSDAQVTVSRPIMPIPTPVRKATGKFPIAGIDGYEEGKVIFGAPNMMVHKFYMSGNNVKRAIKAAGDIDTIKAFLTAEPQFASEIAKKAGMTAIKVSKLLKAAMNEGKIKMVNKMNADSKKRPAFFI